METSLEQARKLDHNDPLKSFRKQFHIPKQENGQDILYFCGNSLGLQPVTAEKRLGSVMNAWRDLAVDGHFYGEEPWIDYHKSIGASLARIVGAKPMEVAVGNTLSANLHFLMVSFYRPTQSRFKILVESDLFPSDLYAVESQIKFHGFDPAEALIKVTPDDGPLISSEKMSTTIAEAGESLALILLGGLNYYTGQVFDMKKITEEGHAVGATVGLDLAHAAGNVELKLHDWNVDFAAWCNYKYLNSGPGTLGGFFVHEKYATDTSLPRFGGWWAQKMDSRFNMRKGFDPIPGAEGWIVSNPPIISMAGIRASMDIFDQVEFSELRKKSLALTGFLEACLKEAEIPGLSILTPEDPERRGCQLSLFFEEKGRSTFEYLHKNGVLPDWREPNVIRISPAPLYNTFEEVYQVVEMIKAHFS